MTVLVVDDELSMREYLEVLLRRAGYQVLTADSVRSAVSLLKVREECSEIGLVVSDMKLGTESGLDVLKAAKQSPSAPEVILITAFGTPSTAVEAMRAGAYDYICKPFDNEEFKLLVAKALEKRAIVRENQRLRSSGVGQARQMVGESASMKAVWTLVEKVAHSPRSTVLITGESGTGKELVARAVHWSSARAGQPFMPVNCAALAEGVLESELFGHVKGAFTGAIHDRVGLLVAAGEGTVFLDEIGEVPQSFQVKLLRVLQERKVKPVGSTQEVPFHARVLAATNKNLDAEVKVGKFREDLLYRLNVITVELPPLRERPDDVPLLARTFLAKMAEELGRPGFRFDPEAMELLRRYRFPGNVRQLQNVVERAATLSDEDVIRPSALPASLRGERDDAKPKSSEMSEGFSLEHHMDAEERGFLLEALKRSDGVKTKAAELLGLTFRSFRYRLAKHGLSDE